MINDWKFAQLTVKPGHSAKVYSLNGYAAPFGRPRKEPVVKELIKVRLQTTHYPGSSGAPTRHSFGTNWEPMDIKGRWMTKTALRAPDSLQTGDLTGTVTANDVATAWTNFVRDEQLTRISWGAIASWEGFIEELEISRESEHEIAWRMRIQVDKRDDEDVRPSTSAADGLTGPDPNDLMKQLTGSTIGKICKVPNEDDYSVDFLTQLDGWASSLNSFASIGNNLVNEFGDITKSVASIQRHFLGAVEGILTDIDELRDFVLGAAVDQILIANTWLNQSKHFDYQAGFDANTALLLEQLQIIKRTVELNAQPEFSQVIVARENDTWESLSIRATGSAGKAAAMRTTADTSAFKPTPGEIYFVPT